MAMVLHRMICGAHSPIGRRCARRFRKRRRRGECEQSSNDRDRADYWFEFHIRPHGLGFTSVTANGAWVFLELRTFTV
jgi:hypothetical protein